MVILIDGVYEKQLVIIKLNDIANMIEKEVSTDIASSNCIVTIHLKDGRLMEGFAISKEKRKIIREYLAS